MSDALLYCLNVTVFEPWFAIKAKTDSLFLCNVPFCACAYILFLRFLRFLMLGNLMFGLWFQYKHLQLIVEFNLSCFLKCLIVLPSPSSREILGSQSNSFLARSMTGWRWSGSSWGKGLLISSRFGLIWSRTSSANWRIVNSLALPMLMGPVVSLFISRIMPSIRSST